MSHFRHRLLHALTGIILTLPLIASAGQLTRAVDGKGGVTAYEYEQGRLAHRTDAAERTVSFQHDAPGNLIAVTNENHESVRFEHDAADRLIAQIGLDGKRTETQLDPLGIPVRVIEAAGTPHALITELERDALGRLLRKITPESITTYTRDALGRVTRIERTDLAQKPIDSLAFNFDTQGNLVQETQTLIRNGRTEQHTLTHAYDALGNRISTTLPDGRVLNHLLYGSGHLHQINLDGRVICDFERDALHREVSRTQGGLSLRTQYDPLSRILARVSQPLISHAPSPEGLNKRYQYDADGELIQRADTWHGEIALEHDPTGRILGARTVGAGKTPALHEQYDYDQAANLLDPVWGGEKRGFVRHNRLLVFEDKRYKYDEYGRLIEKRTGNHTSLRLRWNKEHQLVESTVEKRGVLQYSRYEYDALGRRIARRDTTGAEVRFIWDGMRLLQEKRRDDNTTYVYRPGSHEPLARIDDAEQAPRLPGERAKIFHFHNHINGAPEELTNEAGQTLWRARYQTWGALALEEVPEYSHLSEQLPDYNPRAEHATRQPIRMQGQYADTETGLYYNTFRYYDPDVGRFVSEDPIGLFGGLNLYQYAANADAWIDPWGWAAGRAIIRQYDNNTGRAGHFTIEIENDVGFRLHTHQVQFSDMTTAIVTVQEEPVGDYPVAHSVEIPLPEADEALREQRRQMYMGDLGPYCEIKNSCVTHIETVLKKGGVTMEGGQQKYLRRLGFKPFKKCD